MKILWVKAGGLVPLDLGGRIRSFHIAKELARTHHVTLFTFYAAEGEDLHPQLSKIFDRVECRPLRVSTRRGLGEAVQYARALLSTRPYTIAKFCKARIARDLRKLLREGSYDVIVCDFAAAGGVIPWDFPCRKVLFTHNVEAQIWQRHYEVARNLLWKALCWREFLTMARAERLYARRADHVVTVSPADQDFFAGLTDSRKVSVIPTGVDLDYFQPADSAGDAQRLVFTGTMDYFPNEDGIVYLIREILPLIRRRIPEVILSVVGRRPSSWLQALAAKTLGVEVTGRVEDVRPYIREAAVYVVPLRVGGGTRLKIFEAMAMGKAIVSTSIGAEGLDVRHDRDIVLADGPPAFANAVVDLLQDEARRRRIGGAATELASRYSWPRIASRFSEILSAVVESGKPHTPPVKV
jgi:polysaccharide biosynthesis protein PslH